MGLFLISLFPDLASFPRQIFALADVPGGSIIALLLIAMVFSVGCISLLIYWLEQCRDQIDGICRNIAIASCEPFRNLDEQSIAIVIPSFNEASNLEVLLPEIPDCVRGFPTAIIVVDDGSCDNTGKIVRARNCFLVKHPVNRGGGAALRTGIEFASLGNPVAVVTMDGDGQHDPQSIGELVGPILGNDADLVIGSRILGTYDEESKIRTFGVKIFSHLIRLLTGYYVTDCSSGFRAVAIGSFKQLKLKQDQYHTAEVIIELAKKRGRIKEVPIHIAKRRSGVSKKGRDVFYGFKFFFVIIFTWLR
jgi:glycosyltransferase involved in cell wall biosynthesis